MSVADNKRAIIENVNDVLKNIVQVEYSKHRSFDNFFINIFGAAYCYFQKKPCINVCRIVRVRDGCMPSLKNRLY